MGKGKEIEPEIRKLIIKHHTEGKSERQIAEILSKPRSTINSIIRAYKITGSCSRKPRSGRPSKMSSRTRAQIIRSVKQNPKISAPKIAVNVAEATGVAISAQTVRNVLHSDDYHGRVARKKSFISAANKVKRLNFAVEHGDKPQSFWDKVIWSDESKFQLFQSKRRVRVWRRPNTELETKHLVPTVKHGGGSATVWGCMTAAGVGKLEFIDGIMDQYVYKGILERNLMTSAQEFGIENDFVFQQDNDPKHTARRVKEWLNENIPNVLGWPAQSPDLNPIEHLWEHLDRKIHEKTISNLKDLKSTIQTEWNNIPASVTKKLVESMPRRLQAVRKSKGNPTKY